MFRGAGLFVFPLMLVYAASITASSKCKNGPVLKPQYYYRL